MKQDLVRWWGWGFFTAMLVAALSLWLLQGRAHSAADTGAKGASFRDELIDFAQPLRWDEEAPSNRMPTFVCRDSKVEDCVDDLRFLTLQVQAVAIDMHYHLVWGRDYQDKHTKVPEQARTRLQALRSEVTRPTIPAACRDLRLYLIDVIDGMDSAYNGIFRKGDKRNAKALRRCYVLYQRYKQEEARFIIEEGIGNKRMSCPGPEFLLTSDASMFATARRLLDEGDMASACAQFKQLRQRFPRNPHILLGLSECVDEDECDGTDATVTPDDGEEESPREALLKAILDGGHYNPVLVEAFLKWRSLTQRNWHGSSNHSEIPNTEYNAKRRTAILLVRAQLKRTPNDAWARRQKEELLELPNIERGGLTGNSNLIYWMHSLL